MKLNPLVLALALALNLGSAMAVSIEIDAEFKVSSLGDEIDHATVRREGWKISSDRFGDESFKLKLKVDESQLPLYKSVGPAALSISKAGEVNIGMSVGDHDHSTDTELTLPLVQNKLVSLPAPLTLSNSSGSHADGSWSFDGRVTISVKP